VISEDFEKRIATAMGNPDRDPHGEPIPSEDLVMPEDESVALVDLGSKQEAIVRRVEAQDTDLLKHLESLGLVIGAHVKTLEVSRFDQVVQLQVRGRKEAVVLGPAVTGRVFVELES
jgi:DtxR family Mn-dependent transcriptional regulator